MIDQAYLKAILRYDPETGYFTWLLGRKTTGKYAGYFSNGYVIIQIDYKNYLAHRLAWLYMTGAWPEEFIDHKDTDRGNNKWVNLREATNRQNQYNVSKRKENATGIKGIYKNRNKFRANITTPDGPRSIGTFSTIEEAIEAYDIAAKELHGEFYNISD